MMKTLAVLLFLSASVWAQTTTLSTPLSVARAYNITSAVQVFDNRPDSRQSNVHSICVTGSDTWSAQLEYADTAITGPWTSFGSSGVVTNTSTFCVGLGIGYHAFIRINTTVGSTSATYSSWKDAFLQPSTASGSAVSSVFGRIGAVVATSGDYSFNQIGNGTTVGTFTVGTGGSIVRTGSGIIDANKILGATLTSLTGLVKMTSGVPGIALSTDIIGLFTGCSGTQYLGADGACHAAAGAGTVTSAGISKTDDTNVTLTVTNSPITTSGTINLALGWTGTLAAARLVNSGVHTGDAVGTFPTVTFNNVNSNVGTFGDSTHVARITVNAKGLITAASSVAVTGGGTGCVPGGSATDVLVDDGAGGCTATGVTISSNNISTLGSISTGAGGSVGGAMQLGQGTAPSVNANSFGFIAPASITTSQLLQPPNAVTVAHQVMILGAPTSNVSSWVYKTLPDCTDTGGNHINFTQSTDAFSCGTSSGGGGASGASFLASNNQTGTSTNWQNISILARIAGEALQAYPTSWKVRMRFAGGSPVIGGMKILRTLSHDTTVIDSTTVQISGNSSPTLTTPTTVNTDAISLATDATHDYWFVIFFTNTGANASVTVAANGSANTTAGYASGDQTAVGTIPGITTTNSPYLFVTATF